MLPQSGKFLNTALGGKTNGHVAVGVAPNDVFDAALPTADEEFAAPGNPATADDTVS